MPSPFPGMDPYLEDPAGFPDLHDSLIIYAREALNARLPPPYYAGTAARVWVELPQRHVGPDVGVLWPRQGTSHEHAGAGGEEVREPFLEIYAQPGGERLVTTLEILSLANKSHSSHGRAPYLQMQQEVLKSQVHLVEIDLLRGGVHSTAVPLEQALARTGPFDYHVCVHRFDAPDDYLVYPIRLGERLPIIAVPLLPDDPPVPLDLQALLDRCYDTGQYRRLIQYRETTPVPRLRPEQEQWAQQILREQGLLVPACACCGSASSLRRLRSSAPPQQAGPAAGPKHPE